MGSYRMTIGVTLIGKQTTSSSGLQNEKLTSGIWNKVSAEWRSMRRESIIYLNYRSVD